MNTLSFWATGNNVIHKKLKPGNWAYCFAEYLAISCVAFLALTTFNNANALVPVPLPSVSLPSPLGNTETITATHDNPPPIIFYYLDPQYYYGVDEAQYFNDPLIAVQSYAAHRCNGTGTYDAANGSFYVSCPVGNGIGGILPNITKCGDVVVTGGTTVCPGNALCPDETWIHYDEAVGVCWKPKLIPACPEHASGTPCVCDPGYEASGTSCIPVGTCPEHASGPPCVCDEGYKLNENNECVCFIDDLPDLGNDACTQALETGNKATIERDCPKLNPKLTDDKNGQIQCLAEKIKKLGIPYNGPSATIRTKAYQQHFVEVWAKWVEIRDAGLSDAKKLACAAVIADVNREMGTHLIRYAPSEKGDIAPHVQGNAFDIPTSTIKTLIAQATKTNFVSNCLVCLPVPVIINDVEDYVNSARVNPPACDLIWGGKSKNRHDPIHFQLQHP